MAKSYLQGWKKTSGDEFFQKQRETADKTDASIQSSFFQLMQRIGDEMQEAHRVMRLTEPGKILDLCMAPGGFSASALKFNPRASISGATLPEELGGYKLFVQDVFEGARVRVWYGDLTSLVGDMGMDNDDIAEEHPDFGKFQKEKVWAGELFDLVFCDGQVLRNHSQGMTECRQHCEARRLTCSQILIALRHVKIGGSIVILLHKIGSWETVLTLRAFDQFADIAIFKPLTAHRSRSSFYLVAKNVQPHHENALKTIKTWTEAWKYPTFRAWADDGQENAFSDDRNDGTVLEEQVTKVMNEYGERLVTLGEHAWKIQTAAIKSSTWFNKNED